MKKKLAFPFFVLLLLISCKPKEENYEKEIRKSSYSILDSITLKLELDNIRILHTILKNVRDNGNRPSDVFLLSTADTLYEAVQKISSICSLYQEKIKNNENSLSKSEMSELNASIDSLTKRLKKIKMESDHLKSYDSSYKYPYCNYKFLNQKLKISNDNHIEQLKTLQYFVTYNVNQCLEYIIEKTSFCGTRFDLLFAFYSAESKIVHQDSIYHAKLLFARSSSSDRITFKMNNTLLTIKDGSGKIQIPVPLNAKQGKHTFTVIPESKYLYPKWYRYQKPQLPIKVQGYYIVNNSKK